MGSGDKREPGAGLWGGAADWAETDAAQQNSAATAELLDLVEMAAPLWCMHGDGEMGSAACRNTHHAVFGGQRAGPILPLHEVHDGVHPARIRGNGRLEPHPL